MCFRRLLVKNISNSSTYTVASSCACASPLEVMTIVGLHDFVKVSISASLKSFLLIMCIDVPESTTSSRSSSWRFDASKHLFSGDEKNAALSCSLNLTHFWPASALLRTLFLPLCLLLRAIPKFWSLGATLMRFVMANIDKRRILVSNFGVTYNSLFEFHTLDWLRRVGALPEKRLQQLHVLKHTTQMPCVRWSMSSRSSFQLMVGVTILVKSHQTFEIYVKLHNKLQYIFVPIILLQHDYCTFLILYESTSPQICNHSLSCRTSILEGAILKKWVIASSSTVILAKTLKHSTTGASSPRISGSRWFSLIVLHQRIRRRIWWCNFSTLIVTVAETANCLLSNTVRCTPIVNNLQKFFVNAVLSPDSWPKRSHNFSFWPHSSNFVSLARHFFSPAFSICVNQVLFSSEEFPSHKIPMSWVSQTLVCLICAILPKCHHAGFPSWVRKIPSHLESNSWISFRRLIVNGSAKFSTESWLPMTWK